MLPWRTIRRIGHAIAALALALTASGCTGADADPRPHVVLISIDTLRADHLASHGHPTTVTPRLDALAAEGIRFAHATTAAPTTLASHTSLFTGRYPRAHGVPRNGFTVHSSNRTAAELLSEAGYVTAGFIGSFALESRFGISQGFGHWDETFEWQVDGRMHDQNQRPAQAVTDAALGWLTDVDPDAAPLFLFVHYFDPHASYTPPQPHAGRQLTAHQLGDAKASMDFRDLERAILAHQTARGQSPVGLAGAIQRGLDRTALDRATGLPLGDDRRLAALYAGEVDYVDAEIGRLLDGLADRGIDDDALIVVTSDHGETFWEHADVWNHGLWVHETTVHVPLIVRPPRSSSRVRGEVVATPVSTVDVLPTILSEAGVPAPSEVEGVALQPSWRDGPFERGPVFSEATQPVAQRYEPVGGWRNAQKAKSVRRGRWKLIWTPYLDYRALYDLETDPGERYDLLLDPGPEHLRVRDELTTELRRWLTAARPLPSRFDPSQRQEVSERLRSLGYAGR